MFDEWAETVARICRDAGSEILRIYGQEEFEVTQKSDESPLTAADVASHRTIMKGLRALTPELPVLSEESEDISWSTRAGWRRYWLVDPLDGTKEFISRNGEFTVNVALIEEGVPVLGAVYVPVKRTLYLGVQGDDPRAFREEDDGERTTIRCRSLEERMAEGLPLTVVASRRHGADALEECLARLADRFPAIETTNMGSSLKICLVAEGAADIYPRLAPTCEWDTAAAQAVLEAAGGKVVDEELAPLRYNRKEELLNPHFYVLGDPGFDWNSVLAR